MKLTAALVGFSSLLLFLALPGSIAALRAPATDAPVVPLTGGRWEIEEVAHSVWESINDIGPRGLAVDAAGTVHVAFGGTYLWYDTYNPVEQQAGNGIQKVDSGAYATSLALDAQGRPHIGYMHGDELRYATWTGSAWITRTLCLTACSEPSLALDGNDLPHISYFDRTNHDLAYGRWTGSEWTTEVIDAAGVVGRFSSLAFDAQGAAHISYYDATNGHLKYTHSTAGGWDIETADAADWVGEYTSLALALSGAVHIAYYDWTNDRVRYARRTAGGWEYDTVGSVGRVTPAISLAVNAEGQPYVLYKVHQFHDWDVSQERLKLAQRSELGWSASYIDLWPDAFHYIPALALDSLGRWYIAWAFPFPEQYFGDAGIVFLDPEYAYVRMIGYNGGTKIQLDTQVSLVLGEDGNPNAVYHAEYEVYFARKTTDLWQSTSIRSSSCSTGQGNALQLDAAGRPHISFVSGFEFRPYGCDYYVYTSTLSGAHWDTVGVDEVVYDSSTSLSLDHEGRSHVCYEDRGWGGVKCMHWLTGTLAFSALTTDRSASAPAIVLNTIGGAHVTYWQSVIADDSGAPPALYDDALMYSHWTGMEWAHQVIDQAPSNQSTYSPDSHALFLDSAQRPHVAYALRRSLRYAHLVGSQWIRQTIARDFEGGAVGYGVSLALDADDNPHIITGGDAGIMYVRWDGVAWAMSIVDQGTVSRQSLALDSSGNPHVVYVKDGAVKYARWIPDVTPTPRATRTPTATRTRTLTPSATPTVTSTPTTTPTTGPSYWSLRLEAEDGVVSAPMTRTLDSGASSCYYVSTPPQLVGGQVVFTFTVPVTAAGDVKVWGRVRGLDYIHDSFFVSLDGGSEAVWPIPWQWEWRAVTNGENQPPLVYNLGAGEHTLRIRTRESGSQLDVIEITADLGYTPSWQNVCGTATPTPSATASRSATPSLTATRTPTPSATSTSTAPPTASRTATGTATSTATTTLTVTPTTSSTATPSVTPSTTASATGTPTVTLTGTATATATRSATATSTQTPTTSVTATASATSMPTATTTASPTPTATATPRLYRLHLPLIVHVADW